MNKLPLHDTHSAMGANFSETDGWLLVEDYGSPENEYKAVMGRAGITDLSHRGKLRLSGKDHLKFLQGMLTNDVLKLEPGSGMYSALLTVKGRMVSDMRVYKEEDSVLLELEPGLNLKVAELLKKYRLSYKADIDDISDAYGLFSINGPQANELLFGALDIAPGEMEQHDHLRAVFNGLDVMVVKRKRTPVEGYDLYVSAEHASTLWQALTDAEGGAGITPVGLRAMETLRVEAGIPVYGIDMDESNIPIEAGIWDALNFEKGCYVGQEVVARIKWRGHVNWHLTGFLIEGDRVPSPGDELFANEKKVGRVTSSAHSPAMGTPIALGYIRRELKEPGTRIRVKSADDHAAEATVSALPFLTN